MIVLHESPWYQEILEQGERLAAKRHLSQVLNHRFGEMPHTLAQRLQRLDSPSLETLLGVALSVPSLQEFRQHSLLV